MDIKKGLGAWAKEDPIGMVNALVGYTDKVMIAKYINWKRARNKIRNEKHAFYITANTEAPLFSTNYMEKKLDTAMSYLSSNIPKITLAGATSEDDDAALYKQKLADWMLSNHQINYRDAIMKLGLNIFIAGVGFFKVSFNTEADENQCGVVWSILPPESVKVDPLCGGDLRKARWVIHERNNVPIDEIKYFFHKQVDSTDFGDTVRDQSIYKPSEKIDVSSVIKEGTATIRECYFIDYSTEMIDEVIDEGNIEENIPPTIGKKRVRKYPTWRLLIVCSGVSKPLYDGALPPGYNTLPIFASPYELDELTLYTISLLEKIEPLQDLCDNLDRQIYKNIRLIVNRQRKLQANSGLEPEDLNDIPGYVYSMMNIDGLKWDEPTALSSDIFQYRAAIEDRIDRVSGIYEVAEGRAEAGVTAYSALVTLGDASTRTIKRITSIMADSLSLAFRLSLSLFKTYKGPSFTIKLLGGETLKVVESYPDNISIKSVQGIPTSIPIEEAKPEHKLAWKQENNVQVVLDDIHEDLDFIIYADNELPSSKAQRARLALDLRALGDIDRENLLEALEWQGRGQVLRRMAMAEQQAAVAQQGTPMPPGEEDMMRQALQGVLGGEMTLPETASVPPLPPLQPDRTQEKI